MDEFVMDYIGIGWGTEEGNYMNSVLRSFAESFNKEAEILSMSSKQNSLEYLHKATEAMFLYGMVLEMSNLGMH